MGRRPPLAAWLRNGAAFFAGLAAAAYFAGQASPGPDVEEVTPKLEYLKEHAGEFDTLFFGSSRIYHQIMPRLFDRLTAECGRPTHSFNAAIDGMRPPELNYFVEQVRRNGGGHLRWLCIETGALTTSMNEDRRQTMRGVYWHDLPRLWLLLRAALADRKVPKHRRMLKTLLSFQDPWSDFSPHLELFARQYTHLGEASRLTELLWAPGERPRHKQEYQLGPERDGYLITGRPETMPPADRAEYERRVAERRSTPLVTVDGGPVSQEAFESLLRPFEKAGATAVLIVPPTTGYKKFHLRREREEGRQVLDFSDLEKYPELYADENRVDSDHLNARGAEIFTRLFAREFCQMKGRQP